MNQPIEIDYTPVCAWCLEEQKDTSLRTGSHGICIRHRNMVLAEARSLKFEKFLRMAKREEKGSLTTH